MSEVLLARDVPLWQDARAYLDVRSNDEHTLIAYNLARALLESHEDADESTVLPAILLHDIGWKTVDPEVILEAIGPGAKRPELVRQHETEGVRIAREILERHQPEGVEVDAVLTIIDRHDTWKHATSLNDSLVKDADKAWRFTPHGIKTISGWFDIDAAETIDMLEDFVISDMLTNAGRAMALGFIASGRAQLQLTNYLTKIED